MYSCVRYNSSKSSVLVLNCLNIPRPKKTTPLLQSQLGENVQSITVSQNPSAQFSVTAWHDLLNLGHQTKHRLMHFNVAEQHLGPAKEKLKHDYHLIGYTVHVGVVVPKSPK